MFDETRAVDGRVVAAGTQVVECAGTRRGQPGAVGPVWAAGAGPADPDGPLTIDLDSSIVPVFGRGKQEAAFRLYRGPRLPPAVGDLRRDWEGAVQPAPRRIRGPARAAKSFLTETISRVRGEGASGQLTVRADGGSCSRAVLGTAVKLGSSSP